MRTYSITLLDGTTVTRNDKREYTHAVVTGTQVLGMCGDAAKANRELRKYIGWAKDKKSNIGRDVAATGIGIVVVTHN